MRGARIDVHAIDVVLDDQARHVTQECSLVLVGLAQWFERSLGLSRDIQRAGAVLLFPGPGFAVDLQEEVEGVEAKVHRPAGRVEQLEGALRVQAQHAGL